MRPSAQGLSLAIIATSPDGVIRSWNAGSRDLLGYEADEVIGRPIGMLDPPSEGSIARTTIDEQTALVHKNGARISVALERTPLVAADGVTLGAMLVAWAAPHRATSGPVLDALDRSRDLLAEVSALTQIGIFDRDLEGDRVEWSDELYRIFGVERGRFDPNVQAVVELVHPDDRERFVESIKKLVVSREPVTVQYRIVRPSGEVRVVWGQGRIVSELGGPLRLVGTAQDITELKQIEHEVMLAGRMAAVGTLSAGVAHELNTPLATTMTGMEFVLKGLASIDASGDLANAQLVEMREAIGEARQACLRIRDIVRDLKMFSHAECDRNEPCDVHEVLDASIGLVSHELAMHARVVRDYGDTPRVMANASRIGQVFVQLLLNAAHAIPAGAVEHNQIQVVTRVAGDRVVVEVRDSGVGIDAAHRDRIFDPFFTTRRAVSAIGLGLTICHALVDAVGGTISVESEPELGSTFRVALAIADDLGKPHRGSPRRDVGRRGRVLVIDDDVLLLRGLHRTLAKQHDTVAEANAIDARNRIAAGERFDAIVCDVMMPGMTGSELHAELVQIAPDQAARMIFMTGGVIDSIEIPDSQPQLHKPFELGALRALIEKLLRG